MQTRARVENAAPPGQSHSGLLKHFSSTCHPEERSDEGSAIAFCPLPPRRRRFDIAASPTFTATQKKQLLHPVQDDKRSTQRDLRCDWPGDAGRPGMKAPARHTQHRWPTIETMSFPDTRMRRLRRSESLRALVRETTLEPGDLIYPLFLCPGEGVRRPIGSMPGVFNFSVDKAVREAEE